MSGATAGMDENLYSDPFYPDAILIRRDLALAPIRDKIGKEAPQIDSKEFFVT